jgi:hypothetical protein
MHTMVKHMLGGILRYLAVTVLAVSVFTFCGCPKAEEAQKKDPKPAAQQAAESIRDFGKKPIDKARGTQKLGDDRTQAIDEAVGTRNRQ